MKKDFLQCVIVLWNLTNLRDIEQNLRRPETHEDHIADKGFTSMTHYNLVHKFIPMPLSMKIPFVKAAVDKEWKKLETIPVWDLEEVKSKKEVVLEAQRDKKKVHFATLMDICRPEKRGARTKNTKIQTQSRALGRGVTLSKTTLRPTQFLLNRARLRPKWLPQK